MLKYLLTLLALSSVASAGLGRTVILNNGIEMPAFAVGTFVESYKVNDTYQAMLDSYCNGVRHFDTSLVYGTEEYVGNAINDLIANGDCHGNKVTREDIFLTTKMDYGYTRDSVPISLERSLANLRVDYVDLYLVHLSYHAVKDEDFNVTDVWKGMEDVYKCGKVKSIGVSNHNSTHINKIMLEAEIMPAVNQIEVNPTYPNLELVAYCQEHNIVVVALGSHGWLVPRPHLSYAPAPKLDDQQLIDMADKYGKSTNQLCLRYLMDRGVVPLVKAYTLAHIVDNVGVFDFCLTKKDVLMINKYFAYNRVHDLQSASGINDFSKWYFGMTVEETYEAMGC